MPFFISTEPYKREIESPDGEKGTVTLRRLNAGDQAAIQDTLRMSLSEDADAALAIGTMRMLTVQRALIDWDWSGPKPSQESISQLEPEVFEQIYAHCEIGSPPTRSQDGVPPTQDEQASEAPEATATEEPSENVSTPTRSRPKAVTAS